MFQTSFALHADRHADQAIGLHFSAGFNKLLGKLVLVHQPGYSLQEHTKALLLRDAGVIVTDFTAKGIELPFELGQLAALNHSFGYGRFVGGLFHLNSPSPLAQGQVTKHRKACQQRYGHNRYYYLLSFS
jgi:hypothetical protein